MPCQALIFIPFLPLFTSFFFLKSYGADLPAYCPASKCGGLEVKYPFWLQSNTKGGIEYCGYQLLGLECISSSIPAYLVLQLSSGDFYVKNINYATYTLTLVDISVTTNLTSPRASHNFNLDDLPLEYSKQDLNLTFYFNCTEFLPSSVSAHAVDYLRSGENMSYFSLEANDFDWFDICEDKVVSTVIKREINGIDGTWASAMNDGFVLDWHNPTACSECESSGGYCGYSADSGLEFLCICNNGARSSDPCTGPSQHGGLRRNLQASSPRQVGGPRQVNGPRQASGPTPGQDSGPTPGQVGQASSPTPGQANGPGQASGPALGQAGGNRQGGGGDDGRFGKLKGKDHRLKTSLIIGVSVAGIGLIIICLIFYYCKKYPKEHTLLSCIKQPKDCQNLEAFVMQFGSLGPRRYTYKEIKKMTNSFKDKIGKGGYGDVYRGNLFDNRPVAVKILNTIKGSGEEFINEVASISRTSHVNIVTLLGFCLDDRKRALVYEFMLNGSLEKYIYEGEVSNSNGNHLGWVKVYEIAIGIARGLEYLHKGCNTRILHFDIKPHNILLDEYFCPKISDFGLAKLCAREESVVSITGARGTIGYIAPELVSRNFGVVSHKSDVYSYGMMLLEMVGRRKNFNNGVSHTSEIYFPYWAYQRLVLDEELKLQGVLTQQEHEITRKMILVALWCIQTNPSQRPAMSKVIDMLEGDLQALEIAPKPFFDSPSRSEINSSATVVELS